MHNITKVRKLRMESLEERTLLAVIASGFDSSVEFIASETSYDEFIPIDLGVPFQTEACPCDNPLPEPSILTGSEGYYVSYGLNNHLIAWNEIDNATGYELEYVTGDGEWFTVKTTEDHAVVGNLPYGTNVTYRVRALGDATFGSSDWSATRTFNVCPMDLDGDGFIGPGDYALLSSAWFSTEEDANWDPCFDIDGDGFVGPGDFAYLSSNWLKDTGDEGLSYPAIEKLTITVPDSALTVPSIMKDSANLTVKVRVDASQISGIEAGDDVEIFAVGTYENAENDTDENVPKGVTVVFSVSGRDAYKYNSIPATTVTGEVYPFSSVTLTCDLSKITWGNDKTISSGQQDVQVTFESDAISGIFDGDVLSFDADDPNADVIITAVAHYTNNVNTGIEDISSDVQIRFAISGPKAQKYDIADLSTSGVIEGQAYTISIPSNALTADSIQYRSSSLTTNITINETLVTVNGVTWAQFKSTNGYDITLSATGTYVDANSTGEKSVEVTFALTGNDADKCHEPGEQAITGTVTPASLTIDPSSIVWGDRGDKSIPANSAQTQWTFTANAAGIYNDEVSVIGTATYASTANNTENQRSVQVPVNFSLTSNVQGDNSVVNNYTLPASITVTGYIRGKEAVPTIWYTGIIPKVYIESDGVTNWHTNPYATNINDLAVLNDANSDGVSDDGKDIQTIINGLSGKTLYSGTRSASNASSLALTFGYNDADWETALNNSGVIEEVREEFDMYEGYPFILTNQGDSFSIENLNHDPITFSKVLSNVVVDGVTLSGYLRTDVEAGDGFVGLSVKFDA